ncbi:MAG: hypothetical protein ACR2OO_09060, partial [Thermomicrobiales bacterium]
MDRRRAFGLSVAVILCLGLMATFSPGAARGLLPAGTPVSGTPVASRAASHVASPAASPVGSPVAVGAGAATVFAADEWRLTIVSAARQPGFPELGLGAKAGRDWIVAVVDAANWTDTTATLKPKDFGVRVTGTPGARGFNQKLSESAAAALALEPKSVDAGVVVAANDATRVVLVFRVDSTAVEPALIFNKSAYQNRHRRWFQQMRAQPKER